MRLRQVLCVMVTMGLLMAVTPGMARTESHYGCIRLLPAEEPAVFVEFQGARMRLATSAAGVANATWIAASSERRIDLDGGRFLDVYTFPELAFPVPVPGTTSARIALMLHLLRGESQASDAERGIFTEFVGFCRVQKKDRDGATWTFVFNTAGPVTGERRWDRDNETRVPHLNSLSLGVETKVEGTKVLIGVRALAADGALPPFFVTEVLRDGKQAPVHIEVLDSRSNIVQANDGDLKTLGFNCRTPRYSVRMAEPGLYKVKAAMKVGTLPAPVVGEGSFRWTMLLAGLSGAMASAAEPCRFVVMGDNRPQWGGEDVVTPSPMYQRAISEVNLVHPEFVIIVGDLIYGYDSDMDLIAREWDAFDEATARFEMPVYLLAGNHDVWDDPSEELYRQRYGPLWYSFDVKDCHFVVLDSEDQTAPQKIAGAQLGWLKEDLKHVNGKRIFVLLHQPLWAEDAYPESRWSEDVHPLLAAGEVDTVFAGHWHHYQMMATRDGVRYIITGGAGAEIGDQPLRGAFYHYLWVTAPPAGEGEALLAVVRTGSIDPEDVVTTETREAWGLVDSQLQLRTIPVGAGETTVERTLRIDNPFEAPLTVRVEFGEAAGWEVMPGSSEITVPPEGIATLRLKITADPAKLEDGLSYRVQFEVAGRGELESEYALNARRSVDCRAVTEIQIDGSLEEWSGEPTITVDSEAQLVIQAELWGGPEASSAVAWLGWDAGNLYVAARVTDPSLDPWVEGAHVASGDSIEIYLDGRPEWELGRRRYAEGVTYLVIHPGLGGGTAKIAYQEARFTELPGVEVASRLIEHGYEMEVAIPLSSFPSRGDVLGFDLAVNDNSDPGGRVQLMWAGTADDWEDASGFGLVKIGSE